MSTGRIVTLGMFIIDTFRFVDEDGNDTGRMKQQQIGGGGTYFILAARNFLPASRLGMIIDRNASLFPQEFEKQLIAYGADMWDCREREDGVVATIGCNIYRGEVRDFEWVTPGIRIWPVDLLSSKLWSLPGTSSPPGPNIVHFIGSPSRSVDVLSQIEAIHSGELVHGFGKGWDPTIIFEPFPSTCIPENMPAFRDISPRIAIFSPNHVEALSLLSLVPSSALTSSAASSIVDADEPKYRGSARERELKTLIEQAAREIMTWKPLIGVVIRSGGLGACVVRHKHRADAELPVDIDSSLEVCWIPAYHQPLRLSDGSYAMNPAIVDVTGGGNAFLGGLAAGLQLHRGDLVSAALCGSVGASFAIEQDGLPALEVRDGQERWNGGLTEERLQELAERFCLQGFT